ncbi:hypothetical protein NDU88_009955 [Pleurodeles waltl]|uniref:Uncharacterized protein n=1 Tax=Pleurodeles waltl TaxID=8319 RepID=A0AAV7PXA2_PLEWA|nr:hypothetical protein NDU88_009955 [Pleurodeles waltl]
MKETRPGYRGVAGEEQTEAGDPGDMKGPTASQEGRDLTRYLTACAVKVTDQQVGSVLRVLDRQTREM